MFAVTAQSQRGSGYTSFPRTGPHRSYSHESHHSQRQPSPFPWFSCSAPNYTASIALDPEEYDPPSPTAMRHRNCMPGIAQQQQRCQPQPNYPTTIQFSQSQDGCATPFDEENNDLSRLSVEDTFGFDSSTKDDDDLFERLYTGVEEEDNGTLQSSSVELNPYTANDLNLGVAPKTEKTQIHQNKHKLNFHEEIEQNVQQNQDSIFRAQNNHLSQNAPESMPSSYEKKINESVQTMLSPTVAMDRRHSSRPRSRQAAVISPNSTAPPILRTSTGTSLRRNNTGTTTSSSRSRNRSTSRRHRSRSRGVSSSARDIRRTRSQSTYIAPFKKGDDYHNNVFRGAALIREQLLRSMASADQAMDEADREFMEERLGSGRGDNRRQQQQQFRVARHDSTGQEKDVCDDNGDIDFDYSHAGGVDTATARNAPSPSRSNCVRFAASQDSSALETESRRLDNLVRIYGATSSMSSSYGGHEMKRTSSDKENEVEALPSIDCQVAEVNAAHVISPTSSLGLSSPTSQLESPMQNTKIHNEYAGQYFREDALKPVVTNTPVDSPIPTMNNKAQPEHSRHEQPTVGVDEALDHAQRAGPLWRSLVGNHVKFPSKWNDMLPPTSPTVHSIRDKWSKWYYVARHRVKGDESLNSREFGVRSRRSGGRILMRMVIREMHSQQVCREIAIGCFHPNSKGIRKGDPMPGAEDVREVWMAVRWLMDADADEPALDFRNEGQNYEGVIDHYLMQKRKTLDYGTMGSVLGHRKAVNNENVRAIFGDQAPMTTVDLHEDEIADILKFNVAKKLAVLPALLLLKLFLFSK